MSSRRQLSPQATGVIAAGLVHLVLFAAIFVHPPPGTPLQASSDGTRSVMVSLVRWPASASASRTPQTEADRLETLRQSLLGPSTPDSATPTYEPIPKTPIDAAVLLQAFDEAHGSAPVAKPPAQSAVGSSKAGASTIIEDPLGGAAAPAAYLRAVAGTELWPQLSRCWRPLPSQPKIELLVTLDEHGRLTEPPSIVREASAKIDGLRLEAEAEAVRAASACAPYVLSVSKRQSFRLDFSNASSRPG